MGSFEVVGIGPWPDAGVSGGGQGNADVAGEVADADAGQSDPRARRQDGDHLYALLRVYRFKSASTGDRVKEAHREHEAILEALIRRDVDESEKLMRMHIRRGRDNLVKNHKALAR